MKKRLLIGLVALLGMSSTYAYELGDFIYTRNGRYKVTGANLLKNGTFKDGLTGDWLRADGSEWTAEQDTFTVVPNGGPNDLPYLQVARATAVNWQDDWVTNPTKVAQSTHIYARVSVQPGTRYVMTYKAKSGDDATTLWGVPIPYNGRNGSGTGQEANAYHTFYADSLDREMQTPGSKNCITTVNEFFGNEWKEFAYEYTTTEDIKFISVLFGNLKANECLTDFGIYEVKEVSDDRLVEDAIKQVKFYQDNKDIFPNNQELLEGLMQTLEEYKTNEDAATVNGFIEGFNTNDIERDPIKAFLDDNSVDITEYFQNFYDGGTGWTGTGGNWATEAATGNFMTQHVRQYRQAASGRESYALPEGSYSQAIQMLGGKYLYVVQAQAHSYGVDGSGSSSNYTIPEYRQFTGLRAFINNDSINMDDVSPERGSIYMKIFETEDGEQNVGFYSPGTTSGGGNFRFDNLQLRIMGKTAEDVETYFLEKELVVRRDLFTQTIDAAQKVYDDPQYFFGKTEYLSHIEEARQQYEALNTPTRETLDLINESRSTLDNYRRAYITLNAEYTQLYNDIIVCKEETEKDMPKEKAAFEAAIVVAENYLKEQTETSRDSLTLVQTDATLMVALVDYRLANASYEVPSEIPIVNNSFQLKNTTGWVQDGKTGNDRWQFASDADFSETYRIAYNRGSGANDEKYVYQEIDVRKTGVYEFEAELAVHLSTKGAGDKSYDTGARLYIGNDSIIAITDSKGLGGQNRGAVEKMKVRTILNEIPEGGKLRFGFHRDAIGAVCNMMYMGSCHIYYSGEYDQYLKDSIAVVLAPTKDSLQVAINNAQALYDEVRNPNNADKTPFATAIATAQSIKDNETSTLDEVLGQFTALEDATEEFTFSGVWPAKGKYFDHTILLKNAKFNDKEGGAYNYWVIPEGVDSLLVDNTIPGFTYRHFADGDALSAEMTQEVNGMSKGVYSFAANAAYRYQWNKTSALNWDMDGYALENTWAFLTAGEGQTAIPSIMEGATFLDPTVENSTLQYNVDGKTLNMTVYNARHIHDTSRAAWQTLFDAGLWLTTVNFEPVDGKATVGFKVTNIPVLSAVAYSNARLLFWGDEAQDLAVKPITAETGINGNGAVYSLSGQMVQGALKKGIYIKNGKKFVVK